MIINLIKINQGNDNSVFAGKIAVKHLISSYKIDTYHQVENPNGYQRNLDEKRARNFASYLDKEVKAGRSPVIPTSVLLSYRKPIKYTEKNGICEAVFTDGESFYVVDGQHRTNGFKMAIEELGLNQLLNYELPVIIFENTKLVNEIKQFLLINNNMKKVKTDLARQLMIQLGQKGENIIPQNEEVGIKATNITNMLANSLSSPWKGTLAGPNFEKSARTYNTILSFANSLKPIINSAYALRTKKADELAEELAKYWQAWEKLVPEAFEDHKNYLITKNNGFVSLNRVFAEVYYHFKQVKGINSPTVKDYMEVLKQAGDACEVSYWHKNDGEAAGFGGGYGGFNNLADHILDLLRDNGVEF